MYPYPLRCKSQTFPETGSPAQGNLPCRVQNTDGEEYIHIGSDYSDEETEKKPENGPG